MRKRAQLVSTFELYVLALVNAYERHFGNKLATMEKLATGALRKRLGFHTMSVVVSLLPERIGDSYERSLFAASRRDSIGTNVSDAAWKTQWALTGIQGLSPRDIRTAAMHGFLAKDGTVDILFSLLRFIAIAATLTISAIALVYVGFLLLLWSGFTLDTHIAVIAFQFVLFPTASVFMAGVCLAVCYMIFVTGILPLSTAYKFKRMERDFLRNGILYQIHE